MSRNMESAIQQVNNLLEKAFFAPLQITDWLAFHFNQPFLLGLSHDELLDIFARAALAEERLYPGSDLPPLESVLQSQQPIKVLAHALASLKDDRPFLFHRTLASIPAIVHGGLSPDDYDSIEDMLEEALDNGLELIAGAREEIDSLYQQAQGMLDPLAAKGIEEQVENLLRSEHLLDIKNDSQLRLWLTMGSGADGVAPEVIPHILLEVWNVWSGAVTGARPNARLIAHSLPQLKLSSGELASYLPPRIEDNPSMSATCPYCQGANVINMDKDKIEASHRCSHLIFIGSNDPMHLLRVLILAPASIGEDTLQLLDSYYQSIPDLTLFANIVNDFYQMLVSQGRLKESPVVGQDGQYSHLRAYFAQPMPLQKETEHAS